MARFLYPVLLLTWISVGLAADSFVFPGPLTNPEPKANTFPVLKVGDLVDIAWTSSETVDLIINQRASPSTQIDRTPNSENINANTYRWKVNVDGTDGGAKFDLTFNNQFNFQLFKHGATSTLASSAWFNISDSTIDAHGVRISSASSSSTISSSSTSSASSSTTGTALPTTISQVATPTNLGAAAASETNKPDAPGPIPSTGLSTGVKAAIGVVAAVAVIAILCLVFFFLRRRKSKRAATKPETFASYQDNEQMGHGPSELGGSGPHAQFQTKVPAPGAGGVQAQTKVPHPAEMSGNSHPSELHGSTDMHGAYGKQPTELP